MDPNRSLAEMHFRLICFSTAKRLFSCLAIALSAFLGVSHAQTLTYGLVVGTSLTNDFGHRTFFFINPVSGNVDDFVESSASRGFIMGGGVVEWHFSQRLSLEADAIYRDLHFNETQNGPRDTVVTWEVPVLLKYAFKQVAVLHPFLEGGPSFRAAGNLNGTSPSTLGVSVGAGANIRFHFLNISPALRYTRWRMDTNFLYPTKSDQVEFVVEFTHTSKVHSGRP